MCECASAAFLHPEVPACGFFLLSSQKSHGLDSVSGPSSGEFRVGPSGVSMYVCVCVRSHAGQRDSEPSRELGHDGSRLGKRERTYD